ncbi:hypothetical protein CLOSTMETH_02367 [[Clostridium] methylpentosum DSM 5476]|uniref:Uncharacterized protein n=1 Tax=[Clostridium] methylpentosum DSM 5476 TaxID=537013 RepID=C0EES8_9FIRM|nr:hypothetical protein CLOSTMETH_02367 [[Clostridium] methylpentosum DSM 5476]MDY3989508.1 hypothetical protein [Massilioclostridium sp.]MEE1491410.1 hypothetical protein [Massilioclostridium sp.]
MKKCGKSPPIPKEIQQQLALIDRSQWFIGLTIAGIVLSYYTTGIQRQQLLCSVTKDPCCKCLPDPFPIQSISSLMIIIALVFFYNLSADTLCQSPADAKTCRLNKLGYIASALVLAAAVIRFYSLNTSRKTRLEQTEFGEI